VLLRSGLRKLRHGGQQRLHRLHVRQAGLHHLLRELLLRCHLLKSELNLQRGAGETHHGGLLLLVLHQQEGVG